ncbi:Uncharacterised protein [Bacteroides xylanisolvens]|nr:Uncharacterised protein [Bacteroides xylanisolvens]
METIAKNDGSIVKLRSCPFHSKGGHHSCVVFISYKCTLIHFNISSQNSFPVSSHGISIREYRQSIEAASTAARLIVSRIYSFVFP